MPSPSSPAAAILRCFWLTAKVSRLVTGKVSRAPTQTVSPWWVITSPLQHTQSLPANRQSSPNPPIIQFFTRLLRARIDITRKLKKNWPCLKLLVRLVLKLTLESQALVHRHHMRSKESKLMLALYLAGAVQPVTLTAIWLCQTLLLVERLLLS